MDLSEWVGGREGVREIERDKGEGRRQRELEGRQLEKAQGSALADAVQ